MRNEEASLAYLRLAPPLELDDKQADARRYRRIIPIIRAILLERERQAMQSQVAEVAVR